MSLDLRDVRYELDRFFTRRIKVEHEFEEKDDLLRMTSSLSIKAYGNEGIFLIIGAFKSGSAYCKFVFDKVERVRDVSLIMNEFNNSQSWFRAYVREDKYFEISHNVYDIMTVDNLIDCIEFLTDKIVSDQYVELLRPICDITE